MSYWKWTLQGAKDSVESERTWSVIITPQDLSTQSSCALTSHLHVKTLVLWIHHTNRISNRPGFIQNMGSFHSCVTNTHTCAHASTPTQNTQTIVTDSEASVLGYRMWSVSHLIHIAITICKTLEVCTACKAYPFDPRGEHFKNNILVSCQTYPKRKGRRGWPGRVKYHSL